MEIRMKKNGAKVTSLFLVIVGLYFASILLIDKDLCPWRNVDNSSNYPNPPILATYNKSYALPIFARKYNTTCQTCHTAFPNLTPFGEAFRRNGFRFPMEGNTFDSPDSMALGKEEDKKKFPKAIWPGAIPKSIPLAFVVASEFDSLPNVNTTNQRAQFNLFGGDLGLFTAGTLGDHFGWFGGVEFEANVDVITGERSFEVAVDRVYAVVNPLPHSNPNLVIRIGSFEPHLLGVTEHRALLGDFFALNGIADGNAGTGDNMFTLEGSQQGIEFGGSVANGRLGYTAGVVEGTNNTYNNWKDFYGRLEYKFGGLRLDGVENEHSSTVKHPWRDDSTTLGIFAYQGFATLSSPISRQDDRFEIFGADLTLNYVNFIAYLSYLRNQNNKPLLGAPTLSLGTNQFIMDVEYVWYWLIPGFRYEYFNNSIEHDQRITVGSTFLIRPNIKGFLRGSLTKFGPSSFKQNPAITAGLTLAF